MHDIYIMSLTYIYVQFLSFKICFFFQLGPAAAGRGMFCYHCPPSLHPAGPHPPRLPSLDYPFAPTHPCKSIVKICANRKSSYLMNQYFQLNTFYENNISSVLIYPKDRIDLMLTSVYDWQNKRCYIMYKIQIDQIDTKRHINKLKQIIQRQYFMCIYNTVSYIMLFTDICCLSIQSKSFDQILSISLTQ